MIAWIGHDYMLNGKKVHCQDVNLLNGTARVGVPDTNRMIWDTEWVDFDHLTLPTE